MPGTPEQYMESTDFDQAEDLIDDQIQSGEATGESILAALMESGLRVYSGGEMEEGGEEISEEELPEELPEEMPEEAMEEEPPMGPGALGGPSPGGILIEAARFGMDKDKEKKAKRQKDLEEYE